MRYQKIHNRTKGSIETFGEDASRASDVADLAVASMTASIVSGNSASIDAQTYTSATESLAFRVNFSQIGQTTIKVETTYSGSNDKTISTYLFRTMADSVASALGYT